MHGRVLTLLMLTGEAAVRELPGDAERPPHRDHEHVLGRVLRGLQDVRAPAQPRAGREQDALPGNHIELFNMYRVLQKYWAAYTFPYFM